MRHYKKIAIGHYLTLSALILFTAASFTVKASDKNPQSEAAALYASMIENIISQTSAEALSKNLTFANEVVPFGSAHVYNKFYGNLKIRLSKEFIATMIKKSEEWFPIVEPILAKYGIPEDFKYLAAIESGFNKNARSKAGAVGMWQFMPATARAYGLTVNKKQDDRKHVEKSTIAACRYLTALYNRLGSWTLAAAAYNMGENGLESAMNRQKERDYFNLRLNTETANYVYKILVYKHILLGSNDMLVSVNLEQVAELPLMNKISPKQIQLNAYGYSINDISPTAVAKAPDLELEPIMVQPLVLQQKKNLKLALKKNI